MGLEAVGEGADPESALHTLAREAKVDLSRGAERLTIGGLPAVRTRVLARTREGSVALDLTWIAYRVTRYILPRHALLLRPRTAEPRLGSGCTAPPVPR